MGRSSTSHKNQSSSVFTAASLLMAAAWTRWVGWRYLKSKKSSRFLSFITLLSMSGVGLGVATMIVVLSVMDGFESELKKRLMATDLHVLITPTPKLEGFQAGFVEAKSVDVSGALSLMREDPRVDQVYPVVSTEVILRTGKKVAGVVFKGIDATRMERLRSQLSESAQPELLVDREQNEAVRLPGIFLGQELAYEMQAIPGDLITIVSPTETQGPLESVPRLQRFVIEGIYRSGVPEQELHVVFAQDRFVRSFLRRAGSVSSWEVVVHRFDEAPSVAEDFRKRLSGFQVRDWIELNASLFASLRLERIAMFIALAFIVIVASFNIVTTLTLMIVEKKREISILRAMGAREGHVAAIFLGEGLLIGSLGVGGGVILAVILCWALKHYHFIELPEIYYDRTLPVTFEPAYYAAVAACAFVIVLFSALYPSRRAARIHPLEGIRQG